MASGSRRRVFLLTGIGLAVGASVFAARWFNVLASLEDEGALSVQEAHAKAMAGEIVLVDIRRPEEWARSGIGQGAVPLDMRRPDFTEALLALTGGRKDKPVALICATGVRSRRLSRALAGVGFENVLNVPEGMYGSGAGPGWLRAKLPLRGV